MTRAQQLQQHRGKRQQGIVLVVALALLLILTILAMSSMELATTQEKISGNTRDNVLAFQAAEVALRAAEDNLQAAAGLVFNGSNGLYEICADGDTRNACMVPDLDEKKSKGWVEVATDLEGVSRQPQYVIEQYNRTKVQNSMIDSDLPLADIEYFRITARGFGITNKSMVVLQSTYRRN